MTATDVLPEGFDFTDPDVNQQAIPHAEFRAARQNSPIVWVAQDPTWTSGFGAEGQAGYYAITRHEDVAAISKDSKNWSTYENGAIIRFPNEMLREQIELQRVILINQDPPEHTATRAIISRGFTPRSIAELEETMVKRGNQIVQDAVGRGTGNFVEEIAAELPLQAIAEIMGIPVADRHLVFNWSNRLIGFDDPEFQGSWEDGKLAAAEMYMYANQLAAERRNHPGDDLVSVLVNAEVEGERLTELEFDLFFVLLAVAGNETTRNLIAGGMLALIEHPEQRARLLANPSLMPTAVEEMLRWVSAVIEFRRTATRDTELRGRKIGAGDKVIIYYISANRDEDVFPEPDRFDVGRTPNDHIAFGIGEHFCLGSNLARLEIRVMFEELLRRLPDIQLAGPVDRLRSSLINGIKRMPVAFTPERQRHVVGGE